MALTLNVKTPVEATIITRADTDETFQAATETGAGQLYAITVDNTNNTAAAYVHIFDTAHAGITIGTTLAEIVLKVPGSTKASYILNGGVGLAFATKINVGCVTASGGLTPMTNAVETVIFTD